MKPYPITPLSQRIGVSLVRIVRRKAYSLNEQLETVEGKLPSPPFFRMHRSYVLDLNRVLELRSRSDDEWELKMDLPVNNVLPVSLGRLYELR